jgi:hypothetical protein
VWWLRHAAVILSGSQQERGADTGAMIGGVGAPPSIPQRAVASITMWWCGVRESVCGDPNRQVRCGEVAFRLATRSCATGVYSPACALSALCVRGSGTGWRRVLVGAVVKSKATTAEAEAEG